MIVKREAFGLLSVVEEEGSILLNVDNRERGGIEEKRKK